MNEAFAPKNTVKFIKIVSSEERVIGYNVSLRYNLSLYMYKQSSPYLVWESTNVAKIISEFWIASLGSLVG